MVQEKSIDGSIPNNNTPIHDTKTEQQFIILEQFQKYQPNVIYQLAKEYENHAIKSFHRIKTEYQLRQYYTLLSNAIKCYQYLKNGFQLSPKQDCQITIELCSLIITYCQDDYTTSISFNKHEYDDKKCMDTNIDLVRRYLDSCKMKLVSLNNADYFENIMNLELMLNFIIPVNIGSTNDIKTSINNCKRVQRNLQNESDNIIKMNVPRTSNYIILVTKWKLIFEMAEIELKATGTPIALDSSLLYDYKKILSHCNDLNLQQTLFYQYLLLSFINFCLEEHIDYVSIKDIYQLFKDYEFTCVEFNMWKSILTILYKISNDQNISENLEQFKFDLNKNKQYLITCSKITLDLFPLEINTIIFQYTNLKILISLFQSVSYLVNCHDKSSNFSTKLLPKCVKFFALDDFKKMEKMNNAFRNVSSLSVYQKLQNKMLELVEFYMGWESLLSTIAEDTITSDKDVIDSDDTIYKKVLKVSKLQLSSKKYSNIATILIENYTHILQDIDCTNNDVTTKVKYYDLKLYCLFNLYMLHCNCNNLDIAANQIEPEILKIMPSFESNNLIRCTWILIWIITHFKPFIEVPLVSIINDTDIKQRIITELENFIKVNVVKSSSPPIDPIIIKKYKLKKSELLFFLMEIVGSFIVFHKTEDKEQYLQQAFQLGKHSKTINDHLLYVCGLACLNNSILLYDKKKILIMKNKLKRIVEKLQN
ncbi:uncharacterized protein SCODWIG_03109 [Saccharomycodes ludwigii]|uniref:Uncharacterized protein n=1 Tax=Saccharomycodes ludwigii TaxID=36035 RepID=A0A376B9J0_9ASCO|nr:hypothetical protein SCDLUD_001626 [Saccharomycodes ludwigii]KAH3901843.1 hypothetical protein SCDLUD_001626 [Saccharomycodes ludwigii]SSD61348.1 uncharacterized protein SCODWIG_03109 [Saccharomycodes ludwigii]